MRPGASPGVPVMATQAELEALGTDADIPPDLAGPAEPVLPAVSFGEGRRPESRTQVQMAEFDGPLALLLSLIEARQLDVLTVPLAALADAYLDALGRLTADRLGNVSSFVAIASQLILIKSRAMLPRRTDPTRPAGAPRRRHRPGGRAPRSAASLSCVPRRRCAPRRRGRPDGSGSSVASPVPPTLLPWPARDRPTLPRSTRCASSVRSIGWPQIAPPPEPAPELMARTITITERAEIIRAALRDAPTFVLQDLLAGVRDRVVIAITFLAMLELMKRREIVVDQTEPWGPIVARRTTAAGTGGCRRGGPR